MDAPSGTPLWAFQSRRLPLRIPYVWARGTQMDRHIGLICHAGTGWGEMAPPPHEAWTPAEAAGPLHSIIRADDLTTLDGLPPRLRCGASTAWMDSQAQAEGISLATWLGERSGRRPAATVLTNTLLTSEDPTRLEAEAAAAVEAGFETLKLKVGTGNDLERVAAVRAGAPRAALRLDANGAWSPMEVRRILAELAPFDIEYVEQPVEPVHEALLHALTDGPIPIALDESATDAATIARLREAGTGDVFILKPQRLGGLDRTLAAVEAAGDLPVTITNSLESAIGVTATLHAAALLPTPTACGLATSHYLAEDVATPPPIRAGRMTVPTSPGLGTMPSEVVRP